MILEGRKVIEVDKWSRAHRGIIYRVATVDIHSVSIIGSCNVFYSFETRFCSDMYSISWILSFIKIRIMGVWFFYHFPFWFLWMSLLRNILGGQFRVELVKILGSKPLWNNSELWKGTIFLFYIKSNLILLRLPFIVWEFCWEAIQLIIWWWQGIEIKDCRSGKDKNGSLQNL